MLGKFSSALQGLNHIKQKLYENLYEENLAFF